MANRIFQLKAKVIKNINVAPKYYKIVLSCPYVACTAQPGQFVMLRLSESYQPLLRRPFSIHRIVHSSKFIVHRERKNLKAKGLEILYKVVGKGTEILTEKKPGEHLDILGPLGKGFSIFNNRYPILVGGGVGIAPLLFLAEQLSTVNRQLSTVLIGANTKKEILSEKEFAKLSCSVKIATEDGSAGFKGKVTDLLKHLLSTINYELSTIYACGPKPMLKEISIISKQYHIPTQVSLEEYMACGLGVCLGCMINTHRGYQAACREGPVFDSRIIKW
jgi:dihydroorotate dehydrogenase electron transfer subunit